MRVLRDSSLQCPEKSGSKATGFRERLLLPCKLQTDLKLGTSLAELFITAELCSGNVRPCSPAAVCRRGVSGRSGAPTQLCPSAGHLSQGLLSGVGHRHFPWAVLLTLLSLPLFPPAPRRCQPPSGRVRARERVQQSPRRRRRTGPLPCREGPCGWSPGPGPCFTHRPPAAAAAGAGTAAPWTAAGGVRVPAAALCSAAHRVGVSRSRGVPAIKGCFLPRAGSPGAGAQVQAVLSIWPEGRSCRWKSRRELGAVTRAAERGAGTGVTPRRSVMGAASPLLHTFLLWQLYFLFELQQFLGNLI